MEGGWPARGSCMDSWMGSCQNKPDTGPGWVEGLIKSGVPAWRGNGCWEGAFPEGQHFEKGEGPGWVEERSGHQVLLEHLPGPALQAAWEL